MLVRNGVIWVVGTCPVVAELAQDLARQQTPGNHPVCPIGILRHPLEDLFHMLLREGGPGARGPAQRGFWSKARAFRVEGCDVRLDLVVPEGPENLCGNRHGPGGSLGEVWRIEFEKERVAFRLRGLEARRGA